MLRKYHFGVECGSCHTASTHEPHCYLPTLRDLWCLDHSNSVHIQSGCNTVSTNPDRVVCRVDSWYIWQCNFPHGTHPNQSRSVHRRGNPKPYGAAVHHYVPSDCPSHRVSLRKAFRVGRVRILWLSLSHFPKKSLRHVWLEFRSLCSSDMEFW